MTPTTPAPKCVIFDTHPCLVRHTTPMVRQTVTTPIAGTYPTPEEESAGWTTVMARVRQQHRQIGLKGENLVVVTATTSVVPQRSTGTYQCIFVLTGYLAHGSTGV